MDAHAPTGCRQLAESLAGIVRRTTKGLPARHVEGMLDMASLVLSLAQRIERLEARPQLKYTGVYEAGRKYIEGEVTTHQGGMWVCRRSTMTKPGASDGWQLAVKSGRDGKGTG